MRQYGSAMTVYHGQEMFSVRAFLQPSRSKARQEMLTEYSPAGEIPVGQYVYIGPAEPVVSQGDLVEMAGKRYEMRRVETVYAGDAAIYQWALCREKGGADS